MPLSPVAFPGFGRGLDLRDQPDIVDPASAIDLLNVTFTERGAVRQRDGYAKFTAAEGTNRFDCMIPYYTTGGTNHLVAGQGNLISAVNTSGAVVASTAGATARTANPQYFCRAGSPTAELVYAANGTDTVVQWNGTAWSVPAWTGTTPTGRFVAVTPWDSRLVNARRGGTTQGDSPSTVRFAGGTTPTGPSATPFAFGTNDYVELTPGDGETIMGIITWREYLFVFKESKFFVFYGTSADGAGQPVFNFRSVDTGVGLQASRALCVGPDGVYFLSRTGVYRTTGGPPELVSGPLDPFFLGGTSDFFLTGDLNHGSITTCAMTWHEGQVYVAVPSGSATANDRLFVYDTGDRWWTLYDIPASALASWKISSQPELVFAYASGTKDIGRHAIAYSLDNATAITSRWTSGWFDYKDTGVKTIRELKVWGKGTVIVGVGKDFQTTTGGTLIQFSTGADLWGAGTGTWGTGVAGDTWGSGLSLVPKQVRGIAKRGTVFNISLRSSSGTWGMYRLTVHLRSKRAPSVVKTVEI